MGAKKYVTRIIKNWENVQIGTKLLFVADRGGALDAWFPYQTEVYVTRIDTYSGVANVVYDMALSPTEDIEIEDWRGNVEMYSNEQAVNLYELEEILRRNPKERTEVKECVRIFKAKGGADKFALVTGGQNDKQ